MFGVGQTMLTPTPDRLARRRSSDKPVSAAGTPQLANVRMALFDGDTPTTQVVDEPMPEAIQEALSDELLEMQVGLESHIYVTATCIFC